MATSSRAEINGVGGLTDARQERRIAELCASDPQCREAQPLDAVSAAVRQPGMGLAQIVATIMEGYADRPALGERAKELITDPATGRTSLRLLPRFDTISYRELWDRVGAVASEWHHDPEHPLGAGDFVCFLGFTSSDYTTLDLACIHLGAVCVPLQSSASMAQLTPIIAETGPRILAASMEFLDTAVECALTSTSLRRLIVFDYCPEVDDQRDKLESARRRLEESGSPVVVDSLAAVLERGKASSPAPLFTDPDDDRLVALLYTSGSTGTPKGAMYTERLVSRTWRMHWFRSIDLPSIGINFLPLSHVAGRVSLIGTLACGGTSYFATRSDLSTLFDDIALVRPTELLLVPRICDMLFQWYQSELDRRVSQAGDRDTVEAEVKSELRDKVLGGRVVWAVCGSAPLSADMAAFVESCLDLELHDGYGSTEAGHIMIDNRVARPPVLDYKLVDVPELGYFRTDSPHPRGELLIKTETIIPGYYKRPEVTTEVFDEDGYYRTGDIMAEIGPDQLVYVDRRNNVLKLSQGEFVTVSHLEAIFTSSPLIRQIFVYGNSERAYLLAVIVPTPDAIKRVGNVVENLRPLLSESLQQIAKDTGLNSYEIPRDFLIETEPFSTENGLLSDARKLLRPRLKERYGERLEQLYADLAERETSELRALRHVGRDQPVFDTVVRAAHALLGSSTAELSADAHFTDLGGDSLSALSFSNLLTEIFGVEVPVGVVISPANDLQQLANYIETARESGAKRPTFATVHGTDSSRVCASDLTLDKFLDAKTLAGAKTLPRPSGPPRTVVLTGANGYLGRFLCLEWLERLAQTGGTLICIVRGSNAAAARKRLEDAFDSGDAELVQHFRRLAAKHLEVLAGDIGEPNLGLDEQTWHRLADSVDLIVHAAALVNHVLPYHQLFGPNVVGTAELVQLALTRRMKPVTYVSTVAVAASQATPSALDENADIRVASPVRQLDQSYANGYATSKWAGEVLLREAHDLCGLPVAVFRSDMILAHSRYVGQLNVPDSFTRLLLSLMATGIAPRSFYQLDAQGNRQSAHYDGLPVDFTAEAIATLGGQATDGFQTFNVVNPHDDGISLDVFVDWLNDAGYPIQRIDSYDEWFTRFDTAVRAMPEWQRQHSSLPLMHAFAVAGEANHGSTIPADRFRAAVQAAKVGSDKDIPHVSASLIRKYATDLQQLNLL
ncbi:putative fatty-acid-CoA ligase FadD [Longimycelium tulufanense]|uniref:Carboxylic acid reductase n=1 Tax=Longimycelium tulufanense TaxID=907463 RepID=A0A8J3FU84_9PSEU|nr:carboxylic acid reductase [Longimycelium tulufanense]GGM48616.1 putative fatty-acid-CoA ligase FadD [Longimycelium tulufanense]